MCYGDSEYSHDIVRVVDSPESCEKGECYKEPPLQVDLSGVCQPRPLRSVGKPGGGDGSVVMRGEGDRLRERGGEEGKGNGERNRGRGREGGEKTERGRGRETTWIASSLIVKS